MAKDKKRGFFSWLGFGQKEQAQESETEQKVEAQQEVEEPAQESEAPAVAPETVDALRQRNRMPKPLPPRWLR